MGVTALLGPTNTGKTHRAVERMLDHASGMIGLPLRLLAREVYDRITARIGEERVALVTGEEKRVPRHPDYWVCTVEAMPVDLEVDFVAIDEIQLAASDQRGHVFTDKLLHARGRKETMFLGAGTMASIVGALVPTARIVTHPRLSRLAYIGTSSLARLPPRTAVVAFSVTQVYETAERVRARRGGAAVVLGALSPRARNAQVALFESGEVDYMVATDAIGMGLNLDVRHVAFGALRKFDGKEVRELDPAELGQIAGRAGRYTQDGTFGGLDPIDVPLPIARAIETHAFPQVRRVYYRNADLDMSSVDALLASLRLPPRHPVLRAVRDAEDEAALASLAGLEDIRRRARGSEAVSLLWDVCRIPDYRKLLFESHVALLRALYTQLADTGKIAPDFVAEGIASCDDEAGDLETLVARMAAIRVWTYITNRTEWLHDAASFQARAREVEDRLSDALHSVLVARFVDRGARKTRTNAPRTKHAKPSDAGLDDTRVSRHHPFAALAKLRAKDSAPALVTSYATPEDAWVSACIDAPHSAIVLSDTGQIAFDGRTFAELIPGATFVVPDVRLREVDDFGAGARIRLLRRALAFSRDAVSILLGPLRARPSAPLSTAARGVLYQVEVGLGTALARDAELQIANLSEIDRTTLEGLGIVLGARVVYHPALLKHDALVRRRVLIRVGLGPNALPPPARDGAVSLKPVRHVAPATYTALGFPVFGARAVRADVVERIARTIAAMPEDIVNAPPFGLWIGGSPRDVASVVDAIANEKDAVNQEADARPTMSKLT